MGKRCETFKPPVGFEARKGAESEAIGITKLTIPAPRKSFFESAEIKVLDGFSVLS